MDIATDHDQLADGEPTFELLAGGLGAYADGTGTGPEVLRACFCLTWAGRLDSALST